MRGGGKQCEIRTDYDSGNCSGIFQIFSVDDLNAYTASNFGKNGGDNFQHLKINGDLTATTLDIESPCRITLAADVALHADFVSLDGRKGVLDNNGYRINALTACVLSEEDSAQLGAASDSDAGLRNEAQVTAVDLIISAPGIASVGQQAKVRLTGSFVMESTAVLREGLAIVRAGAGVLVGGPMVLMSSNRATIGRDTTLRVIENLNMDARSLDKCRVTNSADVTLGTHSGSCAPLLP